MRLRAACRMRCSFSTSAMRMKPSPYSPKPRPGETATIGLLDQQLGRTRPSRDGGSGSGIGAQANIVAGGDRDGPAGAAEALDEAIAAALVDLPDLGDAVLRPVERGRGRDLDRREGAVVEIGLHARQRADQALVADREAHPPAGHVVGLGERGELHRDVHRAGHLQDRGRRLAVEVDLGVGDVGEDDESRGA